MFYVSASSLNAYYSCPARFEFSRRLRPLDESQAFIDGSAAHAILAGEQPEKISPRAVSFAKRLRALYDFNYMPAWLDEGNEPVVEVKQTIEVSKKVRLVRVIDAFGVDKETGEIVLVDYKTGTWPYKGADDITPQANGFQAAAYLLPPESFPFFDEWPKRIDFLHAPEKGADKIYTYRWNKEDEENLFEAIEMMRRASSYPKVKGYQCNTCPFFSACFETEGWEKEYEEK